MEANLQIARLREIGILLHVLGEVIVDAQDAGDDRWHEPARQAQLLNAERATILDNLRTAGVLETPPAVVIQAKPAVLGGEGAAHGRG